MLGKFFTYVSPAFSCGFVLGVALFIAELVFGTGKIAIYLMLLTGVWLGTVFWFGERLVKALLVKEFVFAIGCTTTLAIFIVLNVRSYIVENAAYVASRSGVPFSFSHEGFYWGFPLQGFFEGGCFPCDPLGLWSVNWFLAIGTAWLVGTLLKRFFRSGRLK